MNDFNGMSTNLELFYVLNLGSCYAGFGLFV